MKIFTVSYRGSNGEVLLFPPSICPRELTYNISFRTQQKEVPVAGESLTHEDINPYYHENFFSNHISNITVIVGKKELYILTSIKELEANFGKIVESKEKLLRLIASNYIEEEDLKKRPLTKMTRDIMKQLGFIEE